MAPSPQVSFRDALLFSPFLVDRRVLLTGLSRTKLDQLPPVASVHGYWEEARFFWVFFFPVFARPSFLHDFGMLYGWPLQVFSRCLWVFLLRLVQSPPASFSPPFFFSSSFFCLLKWVFAGFPGCSPRGTPFFLCLFFERGEVVAFLRPSLFASW